MAKFEFDARLIGLKHEAQLPFDNVQSIADINPDISDDYAGDKHVVTPGNDEPKRRRGRPREKPIKDPDLHNSYKAAYSQYVEDCRAQKQAIETARLELAEACKQRSKAISEWDSYVAHLRSNVLLLKAQPKPTPPDKGR